MKRFVLILLCCILAGSLSCAEDAPIEAGLTLVRNRFAAVGTVEATLRISALTDLADDIRILDANNQELPQSPIALAKDETKELSLTLPVDEKALQKKSISVKIKYPSKIKKELYYKNYVLKAPIHVVEESALSDLELQLTALPDVVSAGDAVRFPVVVANYGTKESKNIVLEYEQQSVPVGTLKPGESKSVDVDLGQLQKESNLRLTLRYEQDGKEKTTVFENNIIHVGFPYIKFEERK